MAAIEISAYLVKEKCEIAIKEIEKYREEVLDSYIKEFLDYRKNRQKLIFNWKRLRFERIPYFTQEELTREECISLMSEITHYIQNIIPIYGNLFYFNPIVKARSFYSKHYLHINRILDLCNLTIQQSPSNSVVTISDEDLKYLDI